MNKFFSLADVTSLKNGAVFVCPTDTVYGLSCGVNDTLGVAKIQDIKYGKSTNEKHFIVLIADFEDLKLFGIEPANSQMNLLRKVWPGPVSVIFNKVGGAWSHLSHDGTLACRIPAQEDIRAFLRRVGPIVSTSANITGKSPATTADEAYTIFGTTVDFVIDGGICSAEPSTLIKFLR